MIVTATGAGVPLLQCEQPGGRSAAGMEARFEFLAAAMQALGAPGDYQSTMARIAQLAVPRFADWASVHLLTDDGGIRRVAVAHRDPASEPLTTELLRRYEIDLSGGGGAAESLRSAAPVLLEEITEEFLEANVRDPRQREIYALLGMRSSIAAPLVSGDRVFGTLTLLLGHSGRRYGADDVVLAEELARLCAIAVDNADRRRAADEAHDALRERARRLALVAELGQMALASSDTDAILRRAVEAAADALSVSHAAMVALTPDGASLRTVAGVGWSDEVYGELVPAGTASQAGYTLSIDEPVVVRDMAEESRFELAKPLRTHAIVSSMTVVVRSPERAIGVLGAYSDTQREFDAEDVVFLRTIANVVGTAVARSQDEAAVQHARRTAEAAQETLSFLAGASAALSESLDYRATIDKVAWLAVPYLGDWCAVEVHYEAGERELAMAHRDPDRLALALELQRHLPPAMSAPPPVLQVIRTGRPILEPELPESLILDRAHNDDQRARLREFGLRSGMVVPLIAHGRALGAITLVTSDSGRTYGDADLALAQDFARRAAVAIDNARLYEEHERVATSLQASFLPPTDPVIPGLDVATAYRAAGRGTRIGGDFFDVFETAAGWTVVIGDVCGKGPDAAWITGLARHTARAAAVRDADPARLLAVVNEAVRDQIPDDRFCTMAAAAFDVVGGRVRATVACGGHPYPMVIRAGGTVESVVARGTLLGVLRDVDVDARTVDLAPGDLLLLFTDGVTEARSDDAVFGERGLATLLRSLVGRTASGVTTAIETAIVEFQHGLPHDDLALVAVRVPPA